MHRPADLLALHFDQLRLHGQPRSSDGFQETVEQHQHELMRRGRFHLGLETDLGVHAGELLRATEGR